MMTSAVLSAAPPTTKTVTTVGGPFTSPLNRLLFGSILNLLKMSPRRSLK